MTDPETGPIRGDPAAARAAARKIRAVGENEVVDSEQAGRAARHQKARERRQLQTLRKVYATVLLGLMFGQIGVADLVFYWYGNTRGWMIEPEAISAWLGATVIEVIGVVIVVTRFLFSKESFPDVDE